MKKRFSFVILFFLIRTSFLCAGGVEGQVFLKGQPLPDQVIPTAKTKDCGHQDEIRTEFWKIGTNNTLGNVIVWIKEVPKDLSRSIPSTLIEQKGCRYTPHVSAVVVNQAVKVKNSDPTLHNVRGTQIIENKKGKVVFNLGQPLQGMVNEIIFREAGIYSLECDVHPWMQAWIMALNHNFFVVTDETGNFRFEKLPAGEYEILAWHEKFLKPLTQKIKINADEAKKINFEFVLEQKNAQNKF